MLQPPFQAAEQQRQWQKQQHANQRQHREHLVGLVIQGDVALGGIENLWHRHRRHHGGFLEQKDEIGEQRRQAEDPRLRQDHMAQQLAFRQADRAPRLQLRHRHRLDAGAQHLGQVGAAEEGHGDDRRSKTGNLQAQFRQGEVDEEQLDQQRRVTRQLHVELYQALQVRRAVNQDRGVDQRHQQRSTDGDQADLQCDAHRLEKGWQCAKDKGEVEAHGVSLGRR
ncbi:hypothetical protein D9M71_463960 [compost metagenome]